jgi:hypothetical protein
MIARTQDIRSRDPLLLPDRDEPYRLRDVYEKVVHSCRDEIVLDLGDCFLQFTAEPDFDTIAGQFHGRPFGAKRGYRSIGSVAPWSRFLNKECGWTWLAVNQQGYWDTILISFDAVIPNILLNVMASSIYVCGIGPMNRTPPDKASQPKNDKKHARRI